LQNVLPEATFLDIWDLSSKEREELLKNSVYKLILVLGGDDTLKLVSPDVEDQYIVLCNSNAVQSNGVMANFNNHNIKNFIEQILLGNFVIEDWTRLEAKITLPNGQVIKTKPAINELSIRDTNGNLTGRAEVTDMGKIKGTGALVATGAGATGWFSSASKYRYPSGRSFSRTSKRAELCVREPYGTNIDLSKNFTAINGAEILTLISTSNNNLELNVDGQDQLTYPLPRASKVEIRLSDKPLKVINLRKESL
jgi:NAD kinase